MHNRWRTEALAKADMTPTLTRAITGPHRAALFELGENLNVALIHPDPGAVYPLHALYDRWPPFSGSGLTPINHRMPKNKTGPQGAGFKSSRDRLDQRLIWVPRASISASSLAASSTRPCG